MIHKYYSLLLAAAMMIAIQMKAADVVVNEKPFTIPELKEWKGAEGSFKISDATRIVAKGEAGRIARQLAEDYATMFDIRITVAEEGAKAHASDIELKIAARKGASEEEYSITIGDGVQISASSTIGLYWATRTLLQMAEPMRGSALPKGVVKDRPDFALRGLTLDCARKYIPIGYLHKLVKIMSYYKMNTLQIHLNDNGFPKYFDGDWNKTYAAFRMECDTYPGLTARDGFYTKQQFIALQQEAANQGVEIIPEIDAPAHCLAFTRYMPELGSTKYGVDHLDITNPKTLPFLDALWKEYLEGENPVFIGPRVHIGTDEYNNSDPEVVEKFRALTDHLIKYTESYGKQACMWGSLTHAQGNTPVKAEGVVMSLWYNGFAAPDSMLDLGYKGISIPDGLTYIVPAAGYYFDYLNTEYLYHHWTPNIVGNGGVTFKYDDRRILGGMFAVWNDICGNGISVKDIHHRIMPAIQTLATKFWTGKDVSLPYSEFNTLRASLSEAPGVNELGRLPNTQLLIDKLQPNRADLQLGFTEVGYSYRVAFHIKAAKEKRGTVLLASPNATFYLADPITGRLGYERDGYLYTFDFAPYEGEELNIAIEGDNAATRLFVNGKLVENKDGHTFWTDGKNNVKTVETLVFPLQSSGNFLSEITDMEITQEP